MLFISRSPLPLAFRPQYLFSLPHDYIQVNSYCVTKLCLGRCNIHTYSPQIGNIQQTKLWIPLKSKLVNQCALLGTFQKAEMTPRLLHYQSPPQCKWQLIRLGPWNILHSFQAAQLVSFPRESVSPNCKVKRLAQFWSLKSYQSLSLKPYQSCISLQAQDLKSDQSPPWKTLSPGNPR